MATVTVHSDSFISLEAFSTTLSTMHVTVAIFILQLAKFSLTHVWFHCLFTIFFWITLSKNFTQQASSLINILTHTSPFQKGLFTCHLNPINPIIS